MISGKAYVGFIMEQLSLAGDAKSREALAKLMEAMYEELPAPKPKKKKRGRYYADKRTD